MLYLSVTLVFQKHLMLRLLLEKQTTTLMFLSNVHSISTGVSTKELLTLQLLLLVMVSGDKLLMEDSLTYYSLLLEQLTILLLTKLLVLRTMQLTTTD